MKDLLPHNIPHLFDKQRIGGELEHFGPVRLLTKGVPVSDVSVYLRRLQVLQPSAMKAPAQAGAALITPTKGPFDTSGYAAINAPNLNFRRLEKVMTKTRPEPYTPNAVLSI